MCSRASVNIISQRTECACLCVQLYLPSSREGHSESFTSDSDSEVRCNTSSWRELSLIFSESRSHGDAVRTYLVCRTLPHFTQSTTPHQPPSARCAHQPHHLGLCAVPLRRRTGARMSADADYGLAESEFLCDFWCCAQGRAFGDGGQDALRVPTTT